MMEPQSLFEFLTCLPYGLYTFKCDRMFMICLKKCEINYYKKKWEHTNLVLSVIFWIFKFGITTKTCYVWDRIRFFHRSEDVLWEFFWTLCSPNFLKRYPKSQSWRWMSLVTLMLKMKVLTLQETLEALSLSEYVSTFEKEKIDMESLVLMIVWFIFVWNCFSCVWDGKLLRFKPFYITMKAETKCLKNWKNQETFKKIIWEDFSK